MDILLAFIPWKMMWNLQIKGKIGVATAMSMGVFAGEAAITKSVYNPLLAIRDFSYDGANLVLWGQVESAICIIAVSIPVLRALIVEHVHSPERVTGEITGDGGLRTYATDTTGVRPPSFVFPKEEEESNTTPTTTLEMIDWRMGRMTHYRNTVF